MIVFYMLEHTYIQGHINIWVRKYQRAFLDTHYLSFPGNTVPQDKKLCKPEKIVKGKKTESISNKLFWNAHCAPLWIYPLFTVHVYRELKAGVES